MATERDVTPELVVRGSGEQRSAAAAAPRPNGQGEPGLVSAVIPCCGQLEYTRLCVASVLRHSRMPYELIFVDVASLDGTADYLDGVAEAVPVRAQVVHAPSEAQFQAAVEQGLRLARGEYIAWLNNDTVVTDSWLQQLVALANMHVTVGMVGPMSNQAPGQQRVERAPYRAGTRAHAGVQDGVRKPAVDLEAFHQFARQFRDGNKGKWVETDRLGGFCLLAKRSVVNGVPWFNEKDEPGTFDADGLCWRVLQAGYRLALCGDLFVHHFGSRVAVV